MCTVTTHPISDRSISEMREALTQAAKAHREQIEMRKQVVNALRAISHHKGVSADLVKRRISLLSLHPDIQGLVAKRQMPVGHAEALVPLDSPRQMIAFRLFRDSKGMTLATISRIVSDLLAEQSQDSLFDLETFWQQTIEKAADIPLRGKNAVVPVPTRKDLPQPEVRATDTTSGLILRYINALLESGFASEAATIGTLYETLIHSNSMSLPS